MMVPNHWNVKIAKMNDEYLFALYLEDLFTSIQIAQHSTLIVHTIEPYFASAHDLTPSRT